MGVRTKYPEVDDYGHLQEKLCYSPDVYPSWKHGVICSAPGKDKDAFSFQKLWIKGVSFLKNQGKHRERWFSWRQLEQRCVQRACVEPQQRCEHEHGSEQQLRFPVGEYYDKDFVWTRNTKLIQSKCQRLL